MAADQEKFERMLAYDREIYLGLVQWKALLVEGLKRRTAWMRGEKTFNSEAEYQRFNTKFIESNNAFQKEMAAYEARQLDYRTNKTYQLAKSVQEFNDKATLYFKGMWTVVTGTVMGMGAAPLVVPLALIAGATITAVAIAYFVNKYYTETANSLPNVAAAILEMQDANPVLAENMLKVAADLNAQQIEASQSNDFWGQLGAGAKTLLTISGIGIAFGIGYVIYTETQKS